MIRAIVAIDSKRGLADDRGIPWSLPDDKKYYRAHISTAPILMGNGVYVEMTKPIGPYPNLVATHSSEPLRPGFTKVADAVEYLKHVTEDVWVVGGEGLFNTTFQLVEEAYVTQLDADFKCTKFFPDISADFTLVSQTPDKTENGITFRYQVWRRKP